MTILDTLTINDEYSIATCKNGVNIKGARKIINDYLKENTVFKGGWTVWFEEDDGEKYWFKLHNPYKEMSNYIGIDYGFKDTSS